MTHPANLHTQRLCYCAMGEGGVGKKAKKNSHLRDENKIKAQHCFCEVFKAEQTRR